MKTIPVFYMPEQSVKDNVSFSPSAGKPADVVESWAKFPVSVTPFRPLTAGEMIRAHDTVYVRDVLSHQRANGFGNALPSVAKSLLYTSGSMVNAALFAYYHRSVAVSPTSGFHHARYSGGAGFCTFNGLMIAVQTLRLVGAKKIGILDCDMHFGDGTEDIIKRLGLRDCTRHYTFGHQLIGKGNADAWLAKFPKIVAMYQDCDVVLYQAGADPHVDDPLGGVLTTEQMRKRDEIVFETCARLKIPVAWNLAGGYQTPLRKVLDLHDNTMQACVNAYLTKAKELTSASGE